MNNNWETEEENTNILMVCNTVKSRDADNPETIKRYFTIYERDKTSFLQLFSPLDYFDDWAFRIIEDKYELKDIIVNNFLSTNRTEEYDKKFTSVSRIANDLFPMSPSNKGLIYWMKGQTLESYREQELLNKSAQNKGNDLHLALERVLCDNKHVSIKEKNIEEYVKDLEHKDLCIEALTKAKQYKCKESKNYIKDVLYHSDTIYSEIFVKSKKLELQGCIDCLCFYKNNLYISDFKTTSKINKATGKRVFKSPNDLTNYQRQICLYGILLEEEQIIRNINELQYMLNIFHMVEPEYRIYHFEQEHILGLRKEIFRVVDWFNNAKGV